MIHLCAHRELGRTGVSLPPRTALFLKHWVSAGQDLGAQDSLPKGSSWKAFHTWLGEEMAFGRTGPDATMDQPRR